MANVTPVQKVATYLLPMGTFYCCMIFVAKEKFPDILVELNLGLCDVLESLFLLTHYPCDCNCDCDCDNIKYEIRSQILCHAVPPGKFCHS